MRELQRRRRSQFDRGTPGAELELQHSGTSLNPYDEGFGSPSGVYRYRHN
jgi:hypothetical protein